MSTPDGDRESIVRRLRGSQRTLAIVLLVVSLAGVGIVTSQATFTDDFENGNIDGWENPSPEDTSLSEQSIEGDYSLLTETAYEAGSDPSPQSVWEAGPELNVTEAFSVSGTVRPEFIDVEEGYQIRLGLSSGDGDEEGQNAFLLFDASDGSTYLSTYSQADPPAETIDESFDGEWANFRIQTSEGESTIRAKVWPVGSNEPTEWQLERDFSGVDSAEFVVNTGRSDDPQDEGLDTPDRHAYLDSVQLSGTPEDEDFIYTTSDDDTVKKIPSDGGSAVWSYDLPSSGDGIAVDASGDVYAGGHSGELHKIDGDTGENIWTITVGEVVRGVAVDGNGNVYAAGFSDFLHKINGTTGGTVWEYTQFDDEVQEVTVGPNGYVYAGDTDADATVHKIDPNTANKVWEYSGHSDSIEAVTTNENGVFSSSEDGEVHRIDPDDGTQVWAYTGHSDEVESLATDSSGGVYSGSLNGETHKIDASTGTNIWEYTGHTDGVTSTAVDDAGDVYSGDDAAQLHAIDSDAGTQIWVNNDHTDQIEDITTQFSSNPQPPGEPPTNESLTIDTRPFLEHGEEAGYEVTYESGNESNGTLERMDVTNASTVTSNDTNVVTIDDAANEIIATNDTSINNRTFIQAEYETDGRTVVDTYNVTVANETVENLGILPPVSRFSASITDTNMQVIIIAAATGAAASIIATAFAGVAAMTMVMMMGWIAGYVGNGMAMVTVFICLFVSLNVAGNVDYTVRR